MTEYPNFELERCPGCGCCLIDDPGDGELCRECEEKEMRGMEYGKEKI